MGKKNPAEAGKIDSNVILSRFGRFVNVCVQKFAFNDFAAAIPDAINGRFHIGAFAFNGNIRAAQIGFSSENVNA